MQMNPSQVQMRTNEYSNVQIKFVDENTINLEVSDACNCELT